MDDEQSRELVVIDKSNLPLAADLILGYSWPKEVWSLLKNGPELAIDEGGNPVSQNSAIEEMATHCRNRGMNDTEIYAMLLTMSKKWGFTDEPDDEYLTSVVHMVKKLPSGTELVGKLNASGIVETSQTKLYNFMELIETEFEINWIMEHLLTDQGIIAWNGPPGVGKTQIVLRWCMALCMAKTFLKFKIFGRPRKILFMSLEMIEPEIKYFIEKMSEGLSEEDKQLLKENFIFYPLGTHLYLNVASDREEYWRIIQEVQPDGVVIDSWSMAVMGNLSDDTCTRDAFAFVNAVRKHSGCFFAIINHTKKQQGDTLPNTMDSIFGSRFFSAALSSAVVVWPKKSNGPLDEIELHVVKNRFDRKPPKPLLVRRTPSLDFILDAESFMDDVKQLIPKQSKKERKNSELESKPLGELLGLGDDFKLVIPSPMMPASFDPSLLDISEDDDTIEGFQY